MSPKLSLEYEPGVVSVVVPTYNCAQLIGETLKSVMAQTYRPVEVIVVDDGSSDNTAEVVKAVSSNADHRMKLVFAPQRHAGAPAARNHGLSLCRGEMIKFLDSDDILEPGCLNTQVSQLRAWSADVVYGDWERLYVPKRGEARYGPKQSMGDVEDIVEALLRRWNANFCYLYTRRSLTRSDGWDSSLPSYDDVAFVLSVALSGATFKHGECLVGYWRRYHLHGLSGAAAVRSAENGSRMLANVEQVLVQRSAFAPSRRRAMAQHLWMLGTMVYGEDHGLYERNLAEALRIWPAFLPKHKLQRGLVKVLGFKWADGLMYLGRRCKRLVAGPPSSD